MRMREKGKRLKERGGRCINWTDVINESRNGVVMQNRRERERERETGAKEEDQDDEESEEQLSVTGGGEREEEAENVKRERKNERVERVHFLVSLLQSPSFSSLSFSKEKHSASSFMPLRRQSLAKTANLSEDLKQVCVLSHLIN